MEAREKTELELVLKVPGVRGRKFEEQMNMTFFFDEDDRVIAVTYDVPYSLEERDGPE